MFVEELEKIRESESLADSLIKQAKQDGKKALENARCKAEQIIEDAKKSSSLRKEALIAEGESIAGSQYEEALNRCRQQCQEMTEQAASRENRAIELIIERIESGVHC
ncbi:hypothetical protein [Emergencia sp. 1XD21-10]|uniref:hypothetical protein n=1 Tax=Emergencia sp. 1XD21-10 TaxID=2304569 RepID=UPI00137A08C4|nr:hypothetical protein [Emergencia sp. 1XD21-10]NCE98252.1 hypothetical protein [Emergencia sp. 1XD21-10]